MSSRRVLKVAEAIREVVGMSILTDLKDPRIRDVTVTYVEVSPDLKQARIHVSVRGDDTRQRLSLQGLRSAAGFLQKKVGRRIDTRYTPKLLFELDMGVKRSIEITRILDELAQERNEADNQSVQRASPTTNLDNPEAFGTDNPDETPSRGPDG